MLINAGECRAASAIRSFQAVSARVMIARGREASLRRQVIFAKPASIARLVRVRHDKGAS